jgi:hypothetical protein
MNIDEELNEALWRKEPPAGFTERVLAEIRGGEALLPVRPPRRAWRVAAAAALLLALAGGGEVVRVFRAKQQMLTALHITSAKLRDARNHVHEVSTR